MAQPPGEELDYCPGGWTAVQQRKHRFFGDDIDGGCLKRRSAGRILSAAEDRYLIESGAGAGGKQHLLSALGRTLKDAHPPRFDHIETLARLAFQEQDFSPAKSSFQRLFGNSPYFLFAQGAEIRDRA